MVLSTEDERSRFWLGRYEDSAHEPGTAHFLIQELRRARVFADVGAYLGYFTCLAGVVMGGGTVHSFEMSAENVALVAKNVQLNKLTNVHLHRTAVSATGGKETFVEGADPFGAGHRLHAGRFWRPRTHRVRSVSLDDFFTDLEPPDVIKIDVQGAELSVLRGMERLLAEPLVCFIEVHPGSLRAHYSSSSAEVLEFLAQRGFELHRIRDFRGEEPALEPWPANRTLDGEAMMVARKARA